MKHRWVLDISMMNGTNQHTYVYIYIYNMCVSVCVQLGSHASFLLSYY